LGYSGQNCSDIAPPAWVGATQGEPGFRSEKREVSADNAVFRLSLTPSPRFGTLGDRLRHSVAASVSL